MDSKFRYKGLIYDKLGNIQINKRVYLFVVNENNIEYIRVDNVDGKTVYVAPSKKFSLEANAGKSLAQLNERILMNHIAERLRDELAEGKYPTVNDLAKEIERLQSVIDRKDVGKKTKERLEELSEESHINAVNDMLDYFDNSAFKKEEIENDFELPKDIDVTRVFEPIKENIEDYKTVEPKQVTDNVELPVTKEGEPLVEDKRDVGIDESELDNYTISGLLDSKKEELTNDQTNYLEGLLEKREEEIKQDVNPAIGPTEELKETPKVLVKTKNKKNAAFADVVILCLAIQLILFVGLICVMLFLK